MPLDENDLRQIAKYEEKLKPALAELRKWQTYINGVYDAAGEPPPYKFDGDATAVPSPSGARGYKRGEFFQKPMATIVKRILEDREKAGLGPATEDELYETMLAGGYDFEEPNADRAKNNLKISMGKNPAFVKVPGGFYGLTSHYGGARRRTRNADAGDPAAPTNGDTAGEPAGETDAAGDAAGTPAPQA